MEHYCQHILGSGGGVSSHVDDPRKCGRLAHFSEPSCWGDLPDTWYCADCWEEVIRFNRVQHERHGVPLMRP